MQVYEELEGVPTEVLGWERANAARDRILYALNLYRVGFAESGSGA